MSKITSILATPNCSKQRSSVHGLTNKCYFILVKWWLVRIISNKINIIKLVRILCASRIQLILLARCVFPPWCGIILAVFHSISMNPGHFRLNYATLWSMKSYFYLKISLVSVINLNIIYHFVNIYKLIIENQSD